MRRSLLSRAAFLTHVCCGSCWDMVQLDRVRPRTSQDDADDDDRRLRRARILPDVPVPALPVPVLITPAVAAPTVNPNKRAMDDQTTMPASKRARETPVVSVAVQALDLPQRNAKRPSAMELINVRMKIARM
jgi:hypothetical protein